MTRDITKELEPIINFDRIIAEKRKYKPRKASIHPVTKGKKKGPKYSYEECVVLTHMTLYPGSIHGSKAGDVTSISEVFNRSEASIRMTIGNAKTILFQTGKLKNASTNIKKACNDYKIVARNVLDKTVYDILKAYDYNIR
jgi:hypothetical protein